MARARTGALTYPTDHILAVVDAPEDARSLAASLAGDLRLPPDSVIVLEGSDAAQRIDGLGHSHGLAVRVLRMIQFTTMDQMPDFRLYEAAIADGRAVLAVRCRDGEMRRRIRDRLVGGGAHFVNFYGRLYTEELARWRGPELPLPGYLRR